MLCLANTQEALCWTCRCAVYFSLYCGDLRPLRDRVPPFFSRLLCLEVLRVSLAYWSGCGRDFRSVSTDGVLSCVPGCRRWGLCVHTLPTFPLLTTTGWPNASGVEVVVAPCWLLLYTMTRDIFLIPNGDRFPYCVLQLYPLRTAVVPTAHFHAPSSFLQAYTPLLGYCFACSR